MKLSKYVIAIVVLCAIFVLFACGNSDENSTSSTTASTTTTTTFFCEHTGGEATCQTQAICSKCGEFYGEFLEHSWLEIDGEAPTCEAEGFTSYKLCQFCQTIENKTILSPKGHTDIDLDYTCDDCQTLIKHDHDWTNATCKAPKTCTKCGLTEGEFGEHNYQNGICADCGISKPVEVLSNAILSFNNVSNRVSCDSNCQIWQANGVTFINNKKDSFNEIDDYFNPIHCYAQSEIVIQGIGIKVIEFNCSKSMYTTYIENSLADYEGITVTVEGEKVVVEFDTPVNVFSMYLVGQIRLLSIVMNP